MRISRKGIAVIAVTAVAVAGCGSGPSKPGGSGWQLELVASGLEVGLHSSLTTTSDGTVHLAYHDSKELTLHHARRLGPGSWEHTQIDSVGWIGQDVVICADSGDTLHMAYQDMFPKDLKYARYDGSSWLTERVNPFNTAGEKPFIDVKADGIHLVELRTDSYRINFWHGSLDNWTMLSSIHVSDPRAALAFAEGPTGPSVAVFVRHYSYSYSRSSNNWDLMLYVAGTAEGPWTKIVVVSDLSKAEFSYRSLAMAYDSAGGRHLLYRRASGELVDVHSGPVDRGVGGGVVRLVTGPGGDIWALYQLGKGLGVSRFASGVGWRREAAIRDLDPLGQWDIHVDDDGIVHVSVYSYTKHNLWYGRWEPE